MKLKILEWYLALDLPNPEPIDVGMSPIFGNIIGILKDWGGRLAPIAIIIGIIPFVINMRQGKDIGEAMNIITYIFIGLAVIFWAVPIVAAVMGW
jgi:amino acid transporter